VQDNSSGWGTEGSEGRWVQQACIGRSVILNYQVCRDKTSGECCITTLWHCPRLPANVTATLSPLIGRMDDAMCGGRGGVTGVCVCGRRDGQTRVRAGRSAIIIAKALSQVSQWDWENQFNQVYPISEMTYTVSSWMLNSTIPYHQSSMCVVFLATRKEDSTESQISACTGNSWHRYCCISLRIMQY